MYGSTHTTKLLKLPPAPSERHEYCDMAVTLELTTSLDKAIEHINEFGSHHTDTIVTQNARKGEDFLQRVDSACTFHNVSTRFSDGFRFGLGSEVGISTGRIHARGPVGVEGLLSTKWLLRGSGEIVNKDKNMKYTHRNVPLEGSWRPVCLLVTGFVSGLCAAALCSLLRHGNRAG